MTDTSTTPTSPPRTLFAPSTPNGNFVTIPTDAAGTYTFNIEGTLYSIDGTVRTLAVTITIIDCVASAPVGYVKDFSTPLVSAGTAATTLTLATLETNDVICLITGYVLTETTTFGDLTFDTTCPGATCLQMTLPATTA